MAITELQREVINLVVQRFLDLRQPTSLTQVLWKYRNAGPSTILGSHWLFHLAQGGYLPKPFAFESCGNRASLIQAREATKVALHILQNLAETHPEKQDAFKFLEFVDHAAKVFDPKPDRSVLTLGFYLAQHFNVFYQIPETDGRLEDSGDQTSFILSTNIITIDPIHAWDEHITSIRLEPVSASTTKEQGQNLRIFLCHSSQDKVSVRKLHERLSKDGFAPWLDEKNLVGGQDWQQEITKAVKMCHFVLVCLSASSVTKEGFVQKEIKIALDVADEKPEGTIFIIPVRLQEGVTVPTRLSRWQWVNLFDAGGYGQLVRALNTRSREVDTVTDRPENKLESTDDTNKVSDHFLALEQLAGQLVEELSSYRPLDRTLLIPWFEEFRRTPGQFVRYPEIRTCALKLQNVLDRMFVAKRDHQDDQHELRSELDSTLKALLTACDQARNTSVVRSVTAKNAKLLRELEENYMPDKAAEFTGTRPGVPKWFAVAGYAAGLLTLLFIMALVVAGILGHEVPQSTRPLVVFVISLGLALAWSFVGGNAAAKGEIPFPFAKERPIAFSVGGGIAVFVITLLTGYYVYARNAPAPQARFAYVTEGDDSGEEPLKNTKVAIAGGPEAFTSDLGVFNLPQIRVNDQSITEGDPVTFIVPGWTIWYPIDGHMVLPKSTIEPIRIRVLKRGDKRFLDEKPVQGIVAQRTFRFDSHKRNQVPTSQESLRHEWTLFLNARAAEVGLSGEALEAAVRKWTDSWTLSNGQDAETKYRKGLAALYHNDFTKATDYFSDALNNRKNDILTTVAAAYCQYRIGNYDGAEEFLKLLKPSTKEQLIELDKRSTPIPTPIPTPTLLARFFHTPFTQPVFNVSATLVQISISDLKP